MTALHERPGGQNYAKKTLGQVHPAKRDLHVGGLRDPVVLGTT